MKPEQREQLHQLRPRAGINQPVLAYLRARVLQVEGNHEQALEEFGRAETAQMHDRPGVYLSMGDSLIGLRRWGKAKQRFQKVLEIDPVNAHARLGLARCYLGLRRPRLALDEAMACLGLMYHNPLAHFFCARALRWLGRHDEAVKALQVAIAENPVFPDAHLELAELLRKLGKPREAAEHQRLAAAARRRIMEFRAGKPLPEDVDLELDVGLTHTISLAELQPVGALPPIDGEVVIVSGLPRSGTSMMMQVLAAGGLGVLSDGMRQADEDNPRGYYELELAKRLATDNDWLPKARGQAVKVVAQLLPSLPPSESYRIIFMERPLGEVIDSQEAMLRRRGRNESGRSKRRLAKTFFEQIGNIRTVLGAHSDRVRVLAVNYHSALSDPVRTAARVNAFLGGTLDEGAMTKAVDRTLRHQFHNA